MIITDFKQSLVLKFSASGELRMLRVRDITITSRLRHGEIATRPQPHTTWYERRSRLMRMYFDTPILDFPKKHEYLHSSLGIRKDRYSLIFTAYLAYAAPKT